MASPVPGECSSKLSYEGESGSMLQASTDSNGHGPLVEFRTSTVPTQGIEPQPADYETAVLPLNYEGVCRSQVSNPPPAAYKAAALPDELERLGDPSRSRTGVCRALRAPSSPSIDGGQLGLSNQPGWARAVQGARTPSLHHGKVAICQIDLVPRGAVDGTRTRIRMLGRHLLSQ